MEAGRELDARIAEQVMGFCLCAFDPKWLLPESGSSVFISDEGWRCMEHKKLVMPSKIEPYSMDLAAAWAVVDKLHLLDGAMLGQNRLTHTYFLATMTPGGMVILAEAATAPLAICLVAIEAIQVKEPVCPTRPL